jgi:hypothetical protein
MMGCQATKQEYFVSVSLGEYVPEEHFLRAVDHFLDLSEFRQHIAGMAQQPEESLSLSRQSERLPAMALEATVRSKYAESKNRSQPA